MRTKVTAASRSLQGYRVSAPLIHELSAEITRLAVMNMGRFAFMHLEPEQEELVERLVEATRSRPREKREEFMVLRTSGPDLLKGNGIGLEVLYSDLTVLAERGLIGVTDWHRRGSGFNFFVTPEGFTFYEELKTQAGESGEQVEHETLRYLTMERFRAAYPSAFARWNESAEILWTADSEAELSTIGHKCREAVQEFVTTLLDRAKITDANPDRAKTRDRLSALLHAKRGQLGDTHTALLDALFGYWVAACDLVQRQEHAAQREGQSLTWEDGRRVVFQTAVVMFEIDRSVG